MCRLKSKNAFCKASTKEYSTKKTTDAQKIKYQTDKTRTVWQEKSYINEVVSINHRKLGD
jgi:hypothetical protein